MLISLKHKFAFLCNPKCASISVEAMLRGYSDVSVAGPPELRHVSYRSYRSHLEPLIEDRVGSTDLETVCLLREPLSWLYSWYRFRSRFELRDRAGEHHHKSTSEISFAEFLTAHMQPNPPAYADVGSQFDFVRTEGGEIGVDRIFLFEEIGDFVRFMSKKIGQPLRMGYKNMSPRRNRRFYVTSLLDRVVKTAISQLGVRPVAATPAPPPLLSSDLLCAVRQFKRADFELYEQVRRSRQAGPVAMQVQV